MAETQTYLLDLAGIRKVFEDSAELPISSVLEIGAGLDAEYNSTTRRTILGLRDTVEARLSEAATATANKAILTAAVAAINAKGGGILQLPAGTFPIAGPITPPTVPCVIRGAGMGVTVLDWDNVDDLFFKSALQPNTRYLQFEEFTINGRWDFYQDENPAVAPLYVYNVDDLVYFHVEVRNVTWFAFRSRDCERAIAHECRVFESGRDAFSFAECSFFSVIGCQVDHCGDDSITGAVQNTRPTSARHGAVIVGNRISDAQGINITGAKRVTITGNQLERIRARAINVGVTTVEYSAPNAIVIANNEISDVFDPSSFTDGTAAVYIAVNTQPQAGTGIAIPGSPNGAGTFEPLEQAFDNLAATDPQAPGYWLNISGNNCLRTLPAGVLYSSLGYGEMYTKTGYTDFTINSTVLGGATSAGIKLYGGIRNSSVHGNIVDGAHVGLLIDSPTASAVDFENVLISDNEFIRFNYGTLVNSNVTACKNVVLDDNIYDGDPLHEHANRGSNGTWLANSTPVGINIGTGSGFIVRDNSFRRVCNICDALASAGSDKVLFKGNVWDCDPSAAGFSTSNKGVGNIPRGSDKGRVRVVDSDNASGTYGQTLNVCHTDRDSIPTTGKYVSGHFVQNNNLSTTAVFGWIRNTTGNTHTLGSDWFMVPLFTNVQAALTIATGAVTVAANAEAPIVTQPIDTEGAAATDDLDTVSGIRNGQIVILSCVSGARVVTVKDGSGNLRLSGDFVLDNTDDRIALLSDGTNLVELTRSDNAGGTQIQEFAASGTWTKPAGAKAVFVQEVGPGGGGGGGARVASGTAASGGGGGGPGVYAERWYSASDLAATEAITIGAVGSSGAGATVDGNAGSPGGAGGSTIFGTSVTLRAFGGGGGAGGQVGATNSAGGGSGGMGNVGGNASGATAGTAGAIGGNAGGSGASAGSAGVNFGCGSGGSGCASGAAGSTINISINGAGAGPGGGGISAGPTAFAGGNGRSAVGSDTADTYAGGANTGANGTDAATPKGVRGGSGGGGGGNAAGAGGNGGASTRGAGGSGGGSAVGGNGGAGSAGGGGFIRVTTFF